MKKNYFTLLFMLVATSFAMATDPNVTTFTKNSETTVSSCTTNVTLSSAVDYVITDETDALTGTINITNNKAVVIFKNIKPTVVRDSYLSNIKINGQTAVNGTNCRYAIYRHGTIVLPYSNSYNPLVVYDGTGLTGNSKSDFTVNTAYRSLGTWDNAVMSFTLKRGYMVTMANHVDGTGYSHCFIANDADITVNLPATMQRSVSFIRIFPWSWPSKKGYAGHDTTPMGLMNVTWFYEWNAAGYTYNNYEYVPQRHHDTGNAYDGTYHWQWPEWSTINALNGYTHVLGQNEPDNTGSSDEVYMTVDQLIKNHKNFLYSGMRIGTFATCNPNTSMVKSYVDKCKEQNMRVDFVATHYYKGGQSPTDFINDMKSLHDATGLPVWVTEWNNGASWTTETGFTLSDGWYTWGSGDDYAKNGQWLVECLQKADGYNWMERLAVYNDVGQKRYVHWTAQDHWTTTAGSKYGAYQSDFAYNSDNEYFMTWNYSSPSNLTGTYTTDEQVQLTWKNTNTDCTKTVYVQRLNGSTWINVCTLGVSDDETRSVTFTDDVVNTEGVTYRICNVDADGNNRYSNEVSILPTDQKGFMKISFIPTNVDDYYFMFYSQEATTPLCLALQDATIQTGYKAAKYAVPETDGGEMNQMWQLETNSNGGYSLRNLSDTEYVMASPNSWNFRFDNSTHIGAAKSCYLPEYDSDGDYWVLKNVGHSNVYCGLWNNDKNFTVGAELAGNRTLAETDHFDIYAIKKVDFNQMRIDKVGTPTDMNHVVANRIFTWGTTSGTVQGSGSVNYPTKWTFTYTFSGWNDTKVISNGATINDATYNAFNAWAGGLSYAELKQTSNCLPNGIYHIWAYFATTDGYDGETTMTALYGAPTDDACIGRAENITGTGDANFSKYDVYVQVDDNSLTFGARSDAKWFKMANFNIEYMGTTDEVDDDILRLVEEGQERQEEFLFYMRGNIVKLDETATTAPEAVENANVVFLRTIVPKSNSEDNNAWNTICFPFAMDAQLISDIFGEAHVKELETVTISNGNAVFAFKDVSAIEANKPYIMQVETGKSKYLIPDVDIAPSANLTVTVDGVQFIGNYIYPKVMEFAAGNASGTDYYILNNLFKSSTGKTKIKGYRAYFHIPASSGIKTLNMEFGDDATSIILTTEDNDNDAGIYNLAGQLVRTNSSDVEGLSPGIYIVNGKKMLKR